jgi:mannitol/fructose-specific phosphotransferase system IIA component (Ntr-type)
MTVYSTLAEAAFLLDLKSANVLGAIEELVSLIDFSQGEETVASVLAELRERERLREAAGDGEVALLHAVTPQAERIGLAFGRSPTGLEFDGSHAPSVHFVCILLVPPKDRFLGFRVLNGLAELLRDPMVRTQMLWARTVEDLLTVCRQAEGAGWLALASWVRERVEALFGPSAAADSTGKEGA